MKRLLLLCICVLTLCGSPSWAQLPVYESTGTIQLDIDGKQSRFHSTSNTVPGQPGRMVHTANWRTSKPIMLGGVNLAPPGILISISARPTVEPDPDAPQLKMTFSLDENNYGLIETAPYEVSYTIKEGPKKGGYQHAAGTLDVQSATLEGDLLTVTGRAAGTLVNTDKKTGEKTELDYEADFVVHAHRH